MAMAKKAGRAIWDNGHDHQHCRDNALNKASSLCAARGARLTVLRRRVLELIWASHRPVGAYALLDSLRGDHKNAQPPTVYRALDFLLEQGLVHRIQSLNAFVGCNDPDHVHRGLFFICTDCGDALEVEDDGIDKAIAKSAGRQGFEIHGRTIEATGVCPQCQAA